MKKLLRPFGVAARPMRSKEDAMEWAYTKKDGAFPPTRLVFPENPFNDVISNASNILEIGCGSGRNVPWIMENTVADYTGFDPNPTMLKFFWDCNDNPTARRRCAIHSTINDQVRSKLYDVVLTTFVFQHIGFRPRWPSMNVTDITRQILPLIKPGGIWLLFEHEVEEVWQERWINEAGLRQRLAVYHKNFAGFPELNDRGQCHNLIIFDFSNHFSRIESLKPKSIFDFVPPACFAAETGGKDNDYITSGRYYEYYYAIARYIRPVSILEIGVRLGYSLIAMMEGAGEPLRSVVGCDIEAYVPNSNALAEEQIRKFYRGSAKVEFLKADTQRLSSLPGSESYDLIHVDGDHTYKGAMHDLELTIGRTKWVIVDDYEFLPGVRKAVDKFVSKKTAIIESATYLPSVRGTMLIHYR